MSGRESQMPSATRVLEILLRASLGLVLVWSGEVKLFDAKNFAVEVTNYRLLPSLAPWMALVLPGIELAVGVVLLAGSRAWVRASALVATLLMAMFTVAVTQVVARGINIQCGCFGGNSGDVNFITIGRDVLLLAASLTLLVLTTEPAASGTGSRGA